MGINYKEAPDQVQAFLKEQGVSYLNVLDRDAEVSRLLGIRGIPSIFLVDKSGHVRYQGYTLPEADEIQRVL